MTYVPFPVGPPNLSDVVAISAGYSHSLALLKDGSVRAWGDNSLGQVGDGTTTARNTPVVVQGVRNAIAIAAGAEFSVAVLSDGTAMAWGRRDDVETPQPCRSRWSGHEASARLSPAAVMWLRSPTRARS